MEVNSGKVLFFFVHLCMQFQSIAPILFDRSKKSAKLCRAVECPQDPAWDIHLNNIWTISEHWYLNNIWTISELAFCNRLTWPGKATPAMHVHKKYWLMKLLERNHCLFCLEQSSRGCHYKKSAWRELAASIAAYFKFSRLCHGLNLASLKPTWCF